MNIKIFCDFDGTVSVNDVGDRLFRTFGGTEVLEIVKEWMQDKITARECWARQFKAAPSITPQQLEAFADAQKLDPYFKEFVGFCQSKGIEFYVLSDGFDFYIERILRNNGLDPASGTAQLSKDIEGGIPLMRNVKFFANHLNFNGNGTIYPTFPHTDSECEKCGNCKRNHLLTLSGDDDIIVYIGDGYSDRCPAEYADIVFAKRDLLRYCQANNISFYEFQTFKDVIERLEKILSRKRIRKRWCAEMKRREAFMQG